MDDILQKVTRMDGGQHPFGGDVTPARHDSTLRLLKTGFENRSYMSKSTLTL